jgi:hypothetical protein
MTLIGVHRFECHAAFVLDGLFRHFFSELCERFLPLGAVVLRIDTDAQVFLAAMRYGYSRQDLAVMPYGEVIFDLAAMNEDSRDNEAPANVEMATQEDIRSMLG